MNNDEVKKTVQPYLPFSKNTQEILQAIKQSDYQTKTIAQLLQTEGALCANILRIANSPFYGFNREIASISDAVVILGQKTLHNLVLTIGIGEKLKQDNYGDFPIDSMWDHSVRVACLAKRMAKKTNCDPELTYMAGLFHFIGAFALAWAYPEKYNAILMQVLNQEKYYYEVEQDIFGVDNQLVGAFLTEAWHLPPEIISTIKNMHHPAVSDDMDTICAIVILSKAMVVGAFRDCDIFPIIPAVPVDVLKKIGITRSNLEQSLIETIKANQGSCSVM